MLPLGDLMQAHNNCCPHAANRLPPIFRQPMSGNPNPKVRFDDILSLLTI